MADKFFGYYGYEGVLTRDVLKVLAHHWPVDVEGEELKPVTLNRSRFTEEVVDRINAYASVHDEYEKDRVTLQWAGYARNGKIHADLLWQDLATARLISHDGAKVTPDWFVLDQAKQHHLDSWLTFDRDGIFVPHSQRGRDAALNRAQQPPAPQIKPAA